MQLRVLELARGRETPTSPPTLSPAWPGTFCCYLMLHSSGHRDIHRVDADSHSHPGAPKFSVHENVCVCGYWLLAFLSLQPPDQCTTSQPGTQKFSQTFLLPNPQEITNSVHRHARFLDARGGGQETPPVKAPQSLAKLHHDAVSPGWGGLPHALQ